jgi:hypothetical protein
MNPKSLVAPDQDAAAVSAHADASIASITTVANSPLWPAPLSRPAGSDVELPPLNRRASAVARNCRPPEEELSMAIRALPARSAIASSARSKSRRAAAGCKSSLLSRLNPPYGPDCALQNIGTRHIPRQIWCSRSWIIQTKCGTFIAADGPMAVFPERKGDPMNKTLMALAAVATVAVSAVAAPQTAEARNGRIAAGVAAGLIGGAIVGGALAGPGYYGYGRGYGPGYGYYGGPAYVADDYYGSCAWQRQRFWDGYGWRVRRVRICG